MHWGFLGGGLYQFVRIAQPYCQHIQQLQHRVLSTSPVLSFCITKMALEQDTSTNAQSLKRPADSEMTESEVKRIQLNPVPEVETETGGETVRRKRRKYALLLSYSGKGYLGMQRNPGYRTIEDDLLTAMLKADLITEEGYSCPQLFNFQRAARTDKGVSAARQVVSIKLPEDVPDMVTEINKNLNSQIRVVAIKRTTKSFNCKSWCDSRTYSYMCPTFAFAPVEEMTKADYRISPEVLEELRSTLTIYKGTHNFHNFTARKKATDASANRYIMEVECSDPFERDGLEWIVIRIKGQSFMLHQIRKMIGLVMAICRGLASKDVIQKAWMKDRVHLPIAPGLGLVLEEPHYDKYNKKYGSDGIHVALDWSEFSEKIKEFRENFIDSVIIATEKEEHSMLNWLVTLPLHTYDVRETDGEPRIMSGVRSPLGRASVKLAMHRSANDDGRGSEDEAEDEDEGDLDQYRVKPVSEEATNAANGQDCNTSQNGVNNVDAEDGSDAKQDENKSKDE